MNAKVEGRDKVDAPGGERRAHVVHARFDRRPYRGLNNKRRPKANVRIYLDDDAAQTPLGFEGDLNGIPMEGELVRWGKKKKTDPELF